MTLRHLIYLRWLAVCLMAAVTLLSPALTGSYQLVQPLLTIAAWLALVNAYFHYRERVIPASQGGFVLVALLFDLAGWTAFLYLSGGVSNPLISILLPWAMIAAVMLPAWQAWCFGALTTLVYALLWEFRIPLPIADARQATALHLWGMWGVFVISATVAIGFILHLRHSVRLRDSALVRAREIALRNDWLASLAGLATGTAHALATPLGTVQLVLDQLRTHPAYPPELAEDAALIQQQLDHCTQALHHLRIHAEQTPMGTAPPCLPVVLWLQQITQTWQALNPQGEIELRPDPALNTWDMVADVALDRAVSNLLDNAQAAGATRIQLEARLQQQTLVLQVNDNGQGISAQALHCFSQGQSSTSAQGMGIGLLIGRACLERLGGQLHLAPGVNQGTTALVHIPLRQHGTSTT